MYMVLLVLDNPDLLYDVVESWDNAGIRSATIMESTGFRRVRRKAMPMRYLFHPSEYMEEGHLPLFVIVPSEETVQNCLHATEAVVGSLDDPNTGVFASWPLATVAGVRTKPREE